MKCQSKQRLATLKRACVSQPSSHPPESVPVSVVAGVGVAVGIGGRQDVPDGDVEYGIWIYCVNVDNIGKLDHIKQYCSMA